MFRYNDISHIHIELATRCNAGCPVCPRALNGGPLAPQLQLTHITAARFKQWFPSDFLATVQNILMCGNTGDPCTNPDTPKIVKYITEANPNINITIITNGSMRSTEWWASLAKWMPKKSSVVFSIDGLADTNHIYRRFTRWNTIMANAQAFIDGGGRAIWDYLVFRHNEDQLRDAKRLARKMGFVEFNPKRPLGFELIVDGKHLPIPAYKRNGEFDYAIFPARDPQYNQLTGEVYEDYEFPPTISPFDSEIHESLLSNFDEKIAPLTGVDEDYEITTEISCKSTPGVSGRSGHEIYVSAYGEVFPCCWIGSAMRADVPHFPYLQLKKKIEQYGSRRINLNHHSLNAILASDAFENIFTSGWNEAGPRCGKMSICSQTCGKSAIMDGIYVDKPLIR